MKFAWPRNNDSAREFGGVGRKITHSRFIACGLHDGTLDVSGNLPWVVAGHIGKAFLESSIGQIDIAAQLCSTSTHASNKMMASNFGRQYLKVSDGWVVNH